MNTNSTKLIMAVGFGSLLVLMSLVGFISLTQMNETINDMSNVVEVTNSKTESAHAMRDFVHLRGALIALMYQSPDAFEREELRLKMAEYGLGFRSAYDAFLRYGMSQDEKQLLERLQDQMQRSKAANDKAAEALVIDRDPAVTNRFVSDANAARQDLVGTLSELVELQKRNARQALANSVTYHEQTRIIVIILSGIALLIGLLISLMVVREAARKTHEIDFSASHDSLTNLVNRKEFENRLENVLARTTGSRQHALCYLDLDQFKIINDTCGHDAGDELLRQLSRVISTTIRDRDTLGRLGGDEFGLMFESCSLQKAFELAEGIVGRVKQYEFKWQGRSFHVGVSIGIVPLTENTESAARAMSQADVACYAAKDMGRNRVHVYQLDDVQVHNIHKEMSWVADIRKSIADDRFLLYAQPIVAVQDTPSRPMYELLLRVQDDDGNIVSPGDYIPAAERFNLMREVDEWVVEESLKLSARLNQAVVLFINLSANSVTELSFCDYILERVKKYGISSGSICFEITETAAIKNMDKAVEFMEALKMSDVRFSLDDFGSGMSSFSYLKNLPMDYLKIEGDIISSMTISTADHAMVAAINQIGKIMGMKTIAEHVESRVVYDKLTAIGLDYVQGNYLSEPFPATQIESIISRTASTMTR